MVGVCRSAAGLRPRVDARAADDERLVRRTRSGSRRAERMSMRDRWNSPAAALGSCSLRASRSRRRRCSASGSRLNGRRRKRTTLWMDDLITPLAAGGGLCAVLHRRGAPQRPDAHLLGAVLRGDGVLDARRDHLGRVRADPQSGSARALVGGPRLPVGDPARGRGADHAPRHQGRRLALAALDARCAHACHGAAVSQLDARARPAVAQQRPHHAVGHGGRGISVRRHRDRVLHRARDSRNDRRRAPVAVVPAGGPARDGAV